MIRIRHSLVIHRGIETVFPYLADLENMPRWGTSVAVTKVGDGPIGVGSRFHERAEFRGRTMELGDEIVEYEPNRRLAVRTTSPLLESISRTSFVQVSDPDRTRLHYEIEARPHGFVKVLAPLLAPRIRKQFLADVANLKRMLEAGGDGCGEPATPGGRR